MLEKTATLLLFSLSFVYSIARSDKKDGITVNTTLGPVRGVISLSRDGREFYEWLGIPFAEAPVGDLRYASPKSAKPWTGVRKADKYGPACAQLDMIFGVATGSEDCLHLNVHVPREIFLGGKSLPVLVWIHGGYFMTGFSKSYRPEYFMDFEVVVVTINYRLGALGFLNSGHRSARGNMGLKDQALALKWVSENAERFSGDPKKLMIFGESAGGASVSHQLLYLKNEGVIHSAVSQSGVALNAWALYEDPIGQAKEYAHRVNCPTTDAQIMVGCLKTKPLKTLLKAHKNALEAIRPKSSVFVPTIESIIDEETFLSQHPAGLLKTGNFIRIPWLAGYTTHEGLIWMYNYVANETFRRESYLNWTEFGKDLFLLPPELTERAGEIRDFYLDGEKTVMKNHDPGSFDLSRFENLVEAQGDRWFVHGITRAVAAAANFAPVYPYLYSYKGSKSIFNFILGLRYKSWYDKNVLGKEEPFYGVAHGDDISAAWPFSGMFNVSKESPDYQFSKDFIQLFVDFANDHTTAKIKDVPLHREDPKNPLQVLEINDRPAVKDLTSIQKRLEFWNNFEKQKN